MEEHTFKSTGVRSIYLTRLRERIRFDKKGEYTTSDPRIIRALRGHRRIIQSKEDGGPRESVPEQPLPKPKDDEQSERKEPEPVVEDETQGEEETDDGSLSTEEREASTLPRVKIDPDDYTRAQLDDMAVQAGVSPKQHANKKSLAEALNKKRGL